MSAPAVPPPAAIAARWAGPMLVLGAIGISFAPIFVRLSEVGPTATAFWRMALSIPLLLIWLVVRRGGGEDRYRAPATWRDRAGLAMAGFLFAADLASWHIALNITSVANGTLIANFSPLFVTLGAYFLFGHRFRPLFLVGLAAALSGGTLLSAAGATGLGEGRLGGDLLAVVTALFYAAYMLTISRLRRHFRTTTIMIYTGGTAALFLLPLAFALGEAVWPVGLSAWAVVLGLALVSQLGGQVLVAYGLARLHPAFSAVGLILAPTGSALWAWLLLAEPMGPLQMLGGVLALTGIYLARRGTLNRPSEPGRPQA